MMAYHFQNVYNITLFIEFTIIAEKPSTPETVTTGKQSTEFLVCFILFA